MYRIKCSGVGYLCQNYSEDIGGELLEWREDEEGVLEFASIEEATLYLDNHQREVLDIVDSMDNVRVVYTETDATRIEIARCIMIRKLLSRFEKYLEKNRLYSRIDLEIGEDIDKCTDVHVSTFMVERR